MGYFSWKTADTNETIANISSGHPNAGFDVFLLQPNGEPPIAETNGYEGYGEFGGVDAYVWVSKTNNIDKLFNITDEDELRLIGIGLQLGGGVFEAKDGKLFSFHHPFAALDIQPFEGNFGTVQPGYGKTPNELVESGEWEAKSLIDIIKKKYPDFELKPLKFSFDEDAVYEELEASEDCPEQGFFY